MFRKVGYYLGSIPYGPDPDNSGIAPRGLAICKVSLGFPHGF